MNLFASWNIDATPPADERLQPQASGTSHAGTRPSEPASVTESTRLDLQHGTDATASSSRSANRSQSASARGRANHLRLVALPTETLRSGMESLDKLRRAVPDAPVSAVAGYSVGYGKQVFWGVIAAAKKWHADDASAMAAGVAYYLALSLFPMLLLLIAGLGLVFRFTRLGHDAELQILSVVAEHCSPTLEQQVREVLSQLREHSLVGGPFGLFTATLAAIGVFYQFERAFDRIWRYKAKADANWWSACIRILTQRLSAFCLLASVGMAIVLILLANVAVGFVHAWMSGLHIPGISAISIVDACMTLLLNAVVFGMLYRWLPKRRIHMSDALRGGLLAAIVWEVGRQLLGAVLIGVKYTAAYGAIGSFIALLLWCYWGVSIIFFGAEYAQVLSDARRQAADPSHASTTGSDALGSNTATSVATVHGSVVSKTSASTALNANNHAAAGSAEETKVVSLRSRAA